MRIFLIGFMGSGKTYTGRMLASRAGLPFFDLDEYIEQQTGQSISNIFASGGESLFRALERQYLHEFAHEPHFVLACGGGTPCFFDNVDWMNTYGLSIYLKTPVHVLYERLRHEAAKRPLLASLDAQALSDYITQKLAERAPFYEKATICFSVEENSTENPADLSPLLYQQIRHAIARD